MLRAEVVIGTQPIYLATEDVDYDGKLWEGRLVDQFNIERIFDWNNVTNGIIRSLQLKIDNRDLYFNRLQEDHGFLNSQFTIYFDAGDNSTKKFTGNVSSVDSFGLDIMLTITENLMLYLDQPMPDLSIAYDYYSDSGVNENWNAVPIVIGSNTRIKTMWVDRVAHRFLIAAGHLASITKVYFDKTVMYDSVAGTNGYRAKPEDNEIKVRIFLGAGWEEAKESVTDAFGSHESVFPGIAYIEFYDAVTGDPKEPIMTDGVVPDIYVDVNGVRSDVGVATAETNPVKLLKLLLTNPVTSQSDSNLIGGPNGWGLGVPSNKIDDTTFDAAITYCDTQGYQIDGMITSKKDAKQWVDEILKTCAGQMFEEDGKFCIKLDKAKSEVSAKFDETGTDGYEMIIDSGWREPAIDMQINRLRLYYNYDYETGQFNKKPDYNQESPAGDSNLRDETHANRINKWNTATLELPMIKNDTAAMKLAQLYFKRSIKQLKEISFITEKYIPATLDADDLITITSPRFGWTMKYFTIKQIIKGEKNIAITAREYDPTVYDYVSVSEPTTNTRPNYSPYAIPEKPELTTLTQTSTILSDGTNQVKLNFTFVKPSTNVDKLLVYRKLSSEPDTSFSFMASTQGNTLEFVWDKPITGDYNFRVLSLSPYGVYSGLAINTGDKHYYGQPNTESYISIAGDTTAPATPTVSTYSIQHGIVLGLSLATTPADFSHFCIKRRQVDGGTCCAETVIAERYSAVTYVDTDANCALDYKCFQYAAAAIDRTGNTSGFSDWSALNQPSQIQTRDIIASAITSDKITSGQIIAKDFRTTCNVGSGTSGVRFSGSGIEAWCGTTKTIDIDVNGNVTIVGTMCAALGVIGGYTIGANLLTAGTTTNGVGMSSNATCPAFWAGCTTGGSAPFRVTSDGALTATNATITGTVTATCGCIGAWCITSSELKTNSININASNNYIAIAPYLGTPPTSMGNNRGIWIGDSWGAAMSLYHNENNYLQWFGEYLKIKAANFELTSEGKIYACNVDIQGVIYSCCGTIGGWNLTNCRIQSNTIHIDSANNYIAIAPYAGTPPTSYGNNPGVWIGDLWGARMSLYKDANNYLQWDGSKLLVKAANFTLDSSGNICASNATLSGTVCASAGCFTGTLTSCCGSIGGWNISENWIEKTGCGYVLALQSLCNSIYIHNPTPEYGEWLGQIYNNGAWTGRYGLAVTRGAGVYVFRSDTLLDGTDACNQIAGWDFNAACIYKCNLTLNSNGSMIGIGDGNCVVVSSSGISGHDAVLGTTFCLPTNGNRPVFSSGDITSTKFVISTSGTIRTSDTALCSTAGVLINSDGIFASDASTATPANALVRIQNNGNMNLGTKLCWNGTDLTVCGNGCFSGTLAAGIVRANTMYIGGGGSALNDDPGTQDITAWTWGSICSVSDGKTGYTTLRATGGAHIFQCRYIPIDPTKCYRLRAWARSDGTAPGAFYLRTYDDCGGFVDFPGNGNPLTYTWELRGGCYSGATLLQTPGATSARIGIVFNYAHSTGYHEVQDVRLEEVINSDLIVNGAITTDKLTANQIVAKDFRTACNVGSGTSGVMFNCDGIQGWNGSTNTFNLSKTGVASFTGTICATAGCFTGCVTSCVGTIGGFTLAANTLTAGLTTNGVGMSSNTTCPAFWAGCTTGGSAPFRVTSAGALTATNATITGAITATSGSFTGTVTSTAGCIGGWCIKSDSISNCCIDGVLNRKVVMDSTNKSVHYWYQSRYDGAFLGQIFANGWTNRYGLAVINNNSPIFESSINHTSGAIINQIAGWDFNASCLYKGNLVLNSAGSITGNYSVGTSGWCIGADGNAEFNNATMRGTVCATSGSFGCTCLDDYGFLRASWSPSSVYCSEYTISDYGFYRAVFGCYDNCNVWVHLNSQCNISCLNIGHRCSNMSFRQLVVSADCTNTIIRLSSSICPGCVDERALMFSLNQNCASIRSDYLNLNLISYYNCIVNQAPTHICNSLTMCNGNIALNGNYLSGDGGNEGITVDASGNTSFTRNIRIAPDTSESWSQGIRFDMPTKCTWGGLRWSRGCVNYDGNFSLGYTGLDTTDDLVFGANNGGTQVDNILRLTKSGNVGIGTASPGALLNVCRSTANTINTIIGCHEIWYATNTRPSCVNTPRNALVLFGEGTTNTAYNEKWNFRMGKIGLHATAASDGCYNYMDIVTSSAADAYGCIRTVMSMCGNGNVAITGCVSAAAFCTTSAYNLKYCKTDVSVLCNIDKLCIQAWKKCGFDSWGLGPYAEDVYQYLGLGDGHMIPMLDGVALRGIQELSSCNKSITSYIQSLDSCITSLNSCIISLQQSLECRIKVLEDSLNS